MPPVNLSPFRTVVGFNVNLFWVISFRYTESNSSFSTTNPDNPELPEYETQFQQWHAANPEGTYFIPIHQRGAFYVTALRTMRDSMVWVEQPGDWEPPSFTPEVGGWDGDQYDMPPHDAYYDTVIPEAYRVDSSGRPMPGFFIKSVEKETTP